VGSRRGDPKTIHSTPSFNFAKTLDTPIVTPKIAQALRPSFAEALGALDMPKVFTAGVNEALRDLARMPRSRSARGSRPRSARRPSSPSRLP
jgi:hypothetical protein